MRSMQKCCLNVNLSVWLSISAIEGCSRGKGRGSRCGSSKCVEGKFHLQISCCHLINEMWAVAAHTHIRRQSSRYRQMQRCSNRYWQHFSHTHTHSKRSVRDRGCERERDRSTDTPVMLRKRDRQTEGQRKAASPVVANVASTQRGIA